MGQNSLPEQFINGLASAKLQGRAQIVPDHSINSETAGSLVFYMDGAHSPESMEVCGRWFSLAVKEDNQQQMHHQLQDRSTSFHESVKNPNGLTPQRTAMQVIFMDEMFNIMNQIFEFVEKIQT